MLFKAAILAGATFLATTSYAASYELRRINVGSDGHQDRCHFVPGSVKQIATVGDLSTERDIAITTSDEAIQALVDATPGIARPALSAPSYTEWFVRSSPNDDWKLIRSSGSGQLVADDSDAAKKLATFMGLNCFVTFGQHGL